MTKIKPIGAHVELPEIGEIVLSELIEKESIFKKLSGIDVNQYIEKKPTGKKKYNAKTQVCEESYLSYLPWMAAWMLVKLIYPSADYKIMWDLPNNKPYFYDPILGYMIFTQITIDGEVKDCWLPVMDGANNAMKSERYCYHVDEYVDKKKTGKKIEKWVEAATMFDINATIMRCLAKNIAMHGLGSYIYSGDDLPFIWKPDSEEIPEKSALDLNQQLLGLLESKKEVLKEEWIVRAKEVLKQQDVKGIQDAINFLKDK